MFFRFGGGNISMQLSHQMDALLHNWFYGNYGVRVTAAVTFAFLLGSIPIGPVVRWLFAGVDPRPSRLAAAAVPLLDALKGFVATIIAVHGGGQLIGLSSAFAATIGHYYCPWTRWRGGMQIDCVAGVVLAISPPSAAILLAFWLVCSVAGGSRPIGTLFASGLLFLPLWFFAGPTAAFFGIAAGTAIALRLRAEGQTLERFQVQNLDRPAAARRD